MLPPASLVHAGSEMNEYVCTRSHKRIRTDLPVCAPITLLSNRRVVLHMFRAATRTSPSTLYQYRWHACLVVRYLKAYSGSVTTTTTTTIWNSIRPERVSKPRVGVGGNGSIKFPVPHIKVFGMSLNPVRRDTSIVINA